MPKPNKDGWIRHRGGVPKCVEDVMSIRLANGIVIGSASKWFECVGGMNNKIFWKHYPKTDVLWETNIMAYKLKEQPKQ